MYYYVYLLRSIKNPDKTYIGFTNNVKERLARHNAGRSIHTAENKPWHLVTFIGFDTEQKATEFEKYLKVGSGNAFAKKRLL